MNPLSDIAPMAALIVFAIGYLLGSIPSGVVLTRMTGAGDLRAIGSGNIGATNVLRTGRKGLAALTLLLDLLKGVAAVLIAESLYPGAGNTDAGPIAALAAFLGHLYPIWLRFRGGKGIATLLGISLALYWPLIIVFAVVWLALAGLFRFSSLAGICAAISLPIAAWAFGQEDLVWLFMATLLFVLWKHRGNMKRLAAGQEAKIGQK